VLVVDAGVAGYGQTAVAPWRSVVSCVVVGDALCMEVQGGAPLFTGL
jgi:hypothetical protein